MTRSDPMDIAQEDKNVLLAALIGFGVGFVLGLAIRRRVVQVEAQEAEDRAQTIRRAERRAERRLEHQPIVEEGFTRNSARIADPAKETFVAPKDQSKPATRPYVISEDEFMTNEPGHEQTTSVYYEGNQVLLDEIDEVVEDIDYSVGKQNLRCLEGENGQDIVYIRNDAISLDYEVVREAGPYVELNTPSSVDEPDSS
jgi:hypothetical protein